ncbi:MAG: SDR family NAD(P)-dependent oxidoreductase, partial [Deltaproteobacteria bacterium]
MRSVFITGAATGIGRATARLLDAKGWRVFAGVLPGQEIGPLCEGVSSRLTPIEIDITKDDLVRSAVQQVEAGVGKGGLSALINNAGVADLAAGPLEGISLGEMRALFEINVFG